MAKIGSIGNIAIVILFSLLHFAVAAISRTLDYYDDIPLTVLTITMIIVVSIRNNTRIEMMAVLTLVATLLGYLIGTWLRAPMEQIVGNNYFAPATSTFLITSVLGLGTNFITLRAKRFRNQGHGVHISTRNIMVIALSILVLRMVYVAMDRAEIFTEGMLLEGLMSLLGNTWAVLTLLVGNIIITIQFVHLGKPNSKIGWFKRTWLIIALFAIPIITTLLIYFGIPEQEANYAGWKDYTRICSSTMLIDLIVITISYLVQLSLKSNRELTAEREMKHRSEYQYERLKQQINPHFLFNSLNILDYLVQEQETERASAFIRKLASIYRYMLSNDTKPLVKLSEEIEFTDMYIDLLKERFSEGMVVERSIDEAELSRYVVPCALQLLVENATKHNIMSSEEPLHIEITTKGGMLEVRNNLQPRTHGQPSTHLGLANIRRQYLDITNRDIIVEKTDNEFIVKLPIV